MNRVPILRDLLLAGWPNWREALKELFVILLFSLMPAWVGLIAVTVLTITNGPVDFLDRFASSSDLGILSASILGPLLYMMFRDEGSDRFIPAFPGGLWFVVLIVICCIVASVIYALAYLSGAELFFNKAGAAVQLINSPSVAAASWVLFTLSSLLVLFACTIRNAMDDTPRLMRNDTQAFVAEMQSDQTAAKEQDSPESDANKI